MRRLAEPWDYLVVTASNDEQARAYQTQLRLRETMDRLTPARRTLVAADPEGKRIGSGGSTLRCLSLILDRERDLRGLRILIVHAGGDSKRLPAYGPCGKIFVPVPGESYSALGSTLFDRLVPSLLALPPVAGGAGQIVVASGDALVRFDPAEAEFQENGMTALGCHASPQEAARHGVYCVEEHGRLRLYLQKPAPGVQAEAGAIGEDGRSILDIGVMSLDAASAARLIEAFDPVQEEILSHSLDLYREICCAMGSEAALAHYIRSARSSGSDWDDASLARFFEALRGLPFHVRVVPRCSFLHFGSTRQLIESGLALVEQDGQGPSPMVDSGSHSWVEGCRIHAPLTLGGNNVVVGVDVEEALALPKDACLDVLSGRGRDGQATWFVRCYGVGDSFKDPAALGGTFCGRPLAQWLSQVGVKPGEVWEAAIPDAERSLWNARVFPAEPEHAGYRRWLWMFHPQAATPEERNAFRQAQRYSVAEIALLADQQAFHGRRATLRAAEIRHSLPRMFGRESRFSAEDLALALRHASDRAGWVEELLAEARSHLTGGLDNFVYCRVLHSLSTAVAQLADGGPQPEFAQQLAGIAFRQMNETILGSSPGVTTRPRSRLRPDEVVWARGPARIDLGGGWTDTPPYSLEWGGDVANAAVNLNGQPPIHCYCRVSGEPVIRLNSIDAGTRAEIRDLEELLDYQRPGDEFALAKAALAIAGFSPELADWPRSATLADMLREFGGGIELTTLVGIPKGSGLGTSSILGAVITAAVERLSGRTLARRELFHKVLRLEQAITTGGGWQDQIGGGVGGTKLISTGPGLIADPRIQPLPGDLLDPNLNGGTTLLYYTGLTRLASDILNQVVGQYFNRNGRVMFVLSQLHEVARSIADALTRKDAAAFGHSVNVGWELHKRLCDNVTNEYIDSLMERVRPRVHGMRLLGAGSGGFLFMICKSPEDAAAIREMLEAQPLNQRSRFFDFEINYAGLEVTTC